MLLPSATLVLLCLLVGTLPALTVGPVLDLATRAILSDGRMPQYSLAVWHGLNVPLLMSAAAFVGGLAIHAWLTHLGHPEGVLAPLFRRFDGKRAFTILQVRPGPRGGHVGAGHLFHAIADAAGVDRGRRHFAAASRDGRDD